MLYKISFCGPQMAPSILYWVQVNTGRQHSHSHPFFRKFSQFNRTLRQFSKKVSVQSKVGMLASRTVWRPYVGFIRSSHKPIGRTQPKNWNIWLCHIKQRSGKKVDRILCWWYRDWWQSYRGRSSEVWKKAVFALEKQEMSKKTSFLTQKRRLRQAASRREKNWAKKSGIRIGDNPIGGGAARCDKRLFLC